MRFKVHGIKVQTARGRRNLNPFNIPLKQQFGQWSSTIRLGLPRWICPYKFRENDYKFKIHWKYIFSKEKFFQIKHVQNKHVQIIQIQNKFFYKKNIQIIYVQMKYFKTFYALPKQPHKILYVVILNSFTKFVKKKSKYFQVYYIFRFDICVI